MTQVTLNRTDLSAFLSSFGPGVEDLRLDVKDSSLVGGVALATHFITKSLSVDTKTTSTGGGVVIADLAKVLKFLRACTDDKVTLEQDITDTRTGALKLTSGNSTISLPATSTVRSEQSLDLASKLVSEAGESNWESFGDAPLGGYGIVNLKDLSQVAALGSVVGNDKPYQFTVVPSTKEGVIHTGTTVSGQMFHKFHVQDVACDDVCKTQFGPWFPEVLSCLPAGTAEIYYGDDSVLVFNHKEKQCLLVIVNQDNDDE